MLELGVVGRFRDLALLLTTSSFYGFLPKTSMGGASKSKPGCFADLQGSGTIANDSDINHCTCVLLLVFVEHTWLPEIKCTKDFIVLPKGRCVPSSETTVPKQQGT